MLTLYMEEKFMYVIVIKQMEVVRFKILLI